MLFCAFTDTVVKVNPDSHLALSIEFPGPVRTIWLSSVVR